MHRRNPFILRRHLLSIYEALGTVMDQMGRVTGALTFQLMGDQTFRCPSSRSHLYKYSFIRNHSHCWELNPLAFHTILSRLQREKNHDLDYCESAFVRLLSTKTTRWTVSWEMSLQALSILHRPFLYCLYQFSPLDALQKYSSNPHWK